VLATQCLWEERPQTFEIRVDGKLGAGVGAKDLIPRIIGRITTNGATGHVIEYRGSAVAALSMEERMTVCNMSIEAGARAGNGRRRQNHRRVSARTPLRSIRQKTSNC